MQFNTWFLVILVGASQAVLQADWRMFRGNNADGVARESGPKTLEKQAWKVPLPGRGLSGPIVIGEKVVVTASSGYRQDRLHVLCFSTQSGKKLWERQFWATGRTQCHPKMCVATGQPASDGKRLFAFYSSNDLACLDLSGNLLWYRGLAHDFPNASNSLGMASSPVVVGETLIVQVESDAYAFASGIDVRTGLSRWKQSRPQRANWTSPSLLRSPDGKSTLALLQSSAGVSAVDPQTGKEVWNYGDGASTIPSSVVAGGMIFVPSHGLTALRPVGSSSAPELLWRNSRLGPSTASPLALDGNVYTLNRAGVLSCAAAKTGQLRWQLRLAGPFSSTPVAADGHLYFFNENGRALIVKVGNVRRGEIVAQRELGETILCTPALSGGALFVRSDGHLWKFAR